MADLGFLEKGFICILYNGGVWGGVGGGGGGSLCL